jgi:elongation factor 1-beta
MADAIVTLKIMPESPETDLSVLEEEIKKIILKHGGEVGRVKIEPVAFGLKALFLTYVIDEALGGTEPVEKEVSSFSGVNSAEVTDVRRAIG